MVKPAARRKAVHHARKSFGVSERRACGLMRIGRSSYRYRSRRRGWPGLKQRLLDLASQRIRFGYRRLHVLLRREGFEVNHKRIYRMYRLEGLTVRKKKRKRRTSVARKPLVMPNRVNERWSLGFLSDYLSNGRRLKVFSVLDDFSRESLALTADTSITGSRVARELDGLAAERGYPKGIVMDNGPEFIAKIASEWSEMHDIEFKYIQPGKPTQNAFVERFNGSYRRGVLNKCIFEDIDQVREQTHIWMHDYNHYRPHDGLGKISPVKYAELNSLGASPKRIKNNKFVKVLEE